MSKIKDSGWKDPFKSFALDSIQGVTVGIHESEAARDDEGPTNAEVGWYQEYTGEKRSFLRSTFDENRSEYIDLFEKFYAAASRGKIRITAVPSILGAKAKADVKEKIRGRIPPSLKEETLTPKRRAQGTTPLIASGQLIDGIDYEVQ